LHKLINSTWNNDEMPWQCKTSTIVLIYKNSDKTDCNNYSQFYHCYQLRTTFYLKFVCQG
jgi:hypothetical protein